MNIRLETPSEYDAIYQMVKLAFETAVPSDGDEQDFVNTLRASGNYIPALALVAEEGSALIGHIMLTKTRVKTAEGGYDALLLAPVCAALPCRNRGVGSALIHESIARAKAMGFTAIFLVGHPTYYPRFGFVPSVNFGIKHESIPAEFVFALELVPGALASVTGTLDIV